MYLSISLFPPIRTAQGLDSPTWSQWDIKGSFLGIPLKLPQVIQLMEKPRSVQGSLIFELHCEDEDIGRREMRKVWWELPNTQVGVLLGLSVALSLNHLMPYLFGSYDFN